MTATGPGALVIGLVGAESTGKTTLARDLSAAIADCTGLRCAWVPEWLREWCDLHQRTPRADEQAGIAAEQARRIEAAAATVDVVVADTTPLMTAVYSRLLFDDDTLEAHALAWHRAHCPLTLLTALDLPWVADGLQRDGPQVRAPVDAALRAMLLRGGLGFSVVAGSGGARVDAALDAAAPWLRTRELPRRGLFTRLARRDAAQAGWRNACECCDSPECERETLRARRGGG